jgi:hypothetical protein
MKRPVPGRLLLSSNAAEDIPMALKKCPEAVRRLAQPGGASLKASMARGNPLVNDEPGN